MEPTSWVDGMLWTTMMKAPSGTERTETIIGIGIEVWTATEIGIVIVAMSAEVTTADLGDVVAAGGEEVAINTVADTSSSISLDPQRNSAHDADALS